MPAPSPNVGEQGSADDPASRLIEARLAAGETADFRMIGLRVKAFRDPSSNRFFAEVVSSVPNSESQIKGIKNGDRIYEISKEEFHSIEQAEALLNDDYKKYKRSVLITFESNKRIRFVAVRFPEV